MTARSLAALGLLVMGAAIATAWGFQLIGGFRPCPLCLEQRVPYYVAIPVTLLALPFLPRPAGRVALLLAAAAMVWGAGLGVYHAGAEWGFWEGPATCAAGGGGSVRDAGSLMAAIENASVVSCTEVQGRVLGLSFAGWNVVAAGASALLLVGAAVRRR